MKTSELNPHPNLSIPAIPVVCERCKAEGAAGDEAFAGIPDILAFDPVPRRARSDGWKPEHQRAFIAALAITGSPRMAAGTIGKHEFGAQSLRKARGGRSFAEAWDAALDLAREREFERIRENLGELAADTEGALARLDPESYDDGEAEQCEHEDARARNRDRLLAARRLYLAEICSDPQARAAWEALCGPVDWDKAGRLEPQDNEPYGMPNMRDPEMMIPAENGWLGEVIGCGPDKHAELRGAFAEYQRSGVLPGDESPSPSGGEAHRVSGGQPSTAARSLGSGAGATKEPAPPCAIVNPKGPGVRFL